MGAMRGLLEAFLAVLITIGVTLALLLLGSSEQRRGAQALRRTGCLPPPDWSPHLVQMGESLDFLAQSADLQPAELVIANCLRGDVHPGDTIYLPPPQSKGLECGPPDGWQLYEIQPGDTMTSLATRWAISETELWHANCITESMSFPTGFKLYVPATNTE